MGGPHTLKEIVRYSKRSGYLCLLKKKKKEVVHILFKKCTHEINLLHNCRVTVCNPNPEELGYKPNEPNTINL